MGEEVFPGNVTAGRNLEPAYNACGIELKRLLHAESDMPHESNRLELFANLRRVLRLRTKQWELFD